MKPIERPLTENEWLRRVIDTAKIHGWMVGHHRAAPTGRGGYRTPVQGHRGVPDLLLAKGGRVLVAELKTDKGRMGPMQPEWIAAAGDHGRVWRPRDWEAVLAELSAA